MTVRRTSLRGATRNLGSYRLSTFISPDRRPTGPCEDRLIWRYNSTLCRVAKCMVKGRQRNEGREKETYSTPQDQATFPQAATPSAASPTSLAVPKIRRACFALPFAA